MMVFLATCEITVLLAPYLPSEFSDRLLPLLLPRGASVRHNVGTATPAFLLGWSLAVSGALLRMWCYHILGPQYTFQRAVIKEHKLVTSGPYRVVRHPAYTGFIMHAAGLFTAQFCPGSWAWESGVLDGWLARRAAVPDHGSIPLPFEPTSRAGPPIMELQTIQSSVAEPPASAIQPSVFRQVKSSQSRPLIQ